MLRFYKAFFKIYINNIIIFNKSLKEYIQHLHTIFDLLNEKSVIFSLKKFFLNYSTVILLNQKINVFEFIIVTNKIKIIQRLQFSLKFIDLKLYLKFTD